MKFLNRFRRRNGCPYQESRNGSCIHKASKTNRKGKRMCIYKNPTKCQLFIEWQEMKESLARVAKNVREDY